MCSIFLSAMFFGYSFLNSVFLELVPTVEISRFAGEYGPGDQHSSLLVW